MRAADPLEAIALAWRTGADTVQVQGALEPEELARLAEPFAAGIIYPAVLTAWWFLALSADPPDAKYWAILVFGIFVAVSGVYIWWLKKDRDCFAEELRTKGCISAPIQGVGS